MTKITPLIDRLMAHVVVTPGPLATDCWLSTYAVNRTGYTNMGLPGRRTRATHVVAYELTVGPVPAGLILDHLCRVTICANPAHLEPVTYAENTRRGLRGVLRGDFCQRGHPLPPTHTVYKNGTQRRQCKTCLRMRMQKYLLRHTDATDERHTT